MKNLKLILLIVACGMAARAFAATDNVFRLQSMPVESTANRVAAVVSEKPWEHFGKAKPSETMAMRVSNQCFPLDTASIDVDYRIINDEVWEYRLNGFLGTDIIISSNNVTGISTIADQATPMKSDYSEWDPDYYETWHFMGNNYGTPRDGRLVMNSNFWMLIAPGYGYNFASNDVYFDFVSDLIPSFKLLGSYVMAGPDETEVSFDVERDDHLDMAEVRLFKSLSRPDGRAGVVTDTVSIERVKIGSDNKITVKLSAGRGCYSMLALGCDEYGTFGKKSYVSIYSNQRDESHQWKALGKGLFLSKKFVVAWPNSVPTWSEVEIEQATDIEGLYRAVNPFHQKVFVDNGVELNRDMDFYFEFGPSLECRDYLPVGIGTEVINPVHVDNPDLADGWFETNYGWFTLPGVNNCSVIFTSATEATATPQVKSVKYVVVPAADAADYSELPALNSWFDNGKYIEKSATPSAEGKLAFDLGEYDGKLSMVVARGFNASAEVKSIQSKVNYALDGWKKVGTADFTPTLNGFLSFSATLTPEVYVNPLNREMVRVLDPYKPLAGQDTTLIYDFSVDRSVFLTAGAVLPIYSCKMNGEIENVGCNIGISGHPWDPTYEDYPEMLDYRFECRTNVSLRSGVSWDNMIDDPSYNIFYPRRYGNMLVFPEGSIGLYAQGAEYAGYYYNKVPFSFYAPMRFAVDEAVEVAADGQSFVVGDDVVKLRVLVSDVLSRSEEITLEQFIADETLGEILMVKNGRSEELLRPQGTYRVLAVAYNDSGEVANAFETNMALDMEVSSISDVVVGGDTAPEYFNLQGVKIKDPEPGTVVIIKRGDAVSKAVVR